MGAFNIIFVIIAVCLLLSFSAFFSGSETALMAISRLRLRTIAKTKPRRAKIVEDMLRNPERVIGTILLGNNLVNVAMSAIATAFAISLWGEEGIIYVTGVLTLAILIFAEITPKVYAKHFNERVSLTTAPLLKVIMYVFNPLVVVVTFLADKLLLLIGVNVSKIKRPLLTEDEIKTCIKIGSEDGAITDEERKILSRVFTLNDETVGDVMVPKNKMIVLDINMPVEQTLKTMLKSGFSRFPISKGKDMDIIGSVYAKDLLHFLNVKKGISLKKIIRPPYFIEDDKRIDVQLRSFKAKKIHQAVVLDKEGKVTGLITLEDILEELVGSI